MKTNRDYTNFIQNRLFEYIDEFNRKFSLSVQYIYQPTIYFSIDGSDPDDRVSEGYILFNEKRLFRVVLRQVIRKNLINNLIRQEEDVPLLIFSKDTFIIIKRDIVGMINEDKYDDQFYKSLSYSNDDFLSILFKEVNKSIRLIKDDTINVISSIINTALKKKYDIKEISIDDISFDESRLVFILDPLATNRVFDKLLDTYTKKIYRYTSQDSIFQTIQNEKQRINGLAGMNDIHEISYTDNYIYKKSYKPKSSDLYNDKFVMSCCNEILYDNLTMYRLYSDDAKGVCIEYEISKRNHPNIYIKEVEYADKFGHSNTLDFISTIVDSVKIKTHHTIDFFGDSGWKYFFKPYQYNVEKEVRILVDNSYPYKFYDRKWIITKNHQIINPYIEIDLNIGKYPPFMIKSITLGPKHPEKQLNLVQYKHLLSDHQSTLGMIDVQQSKIENYR